MKTMNLPEADLRVEVRSGKQYIFDTIRKQWVVLTPEEWVRQHFVYYMVKHLGYPASLLVVEKTLNINKRALRSDIVAYGRQGTPILAVECKAQAVKITQDTFDQIARYNMQLRVKYLVVTNGQVHYCCVFNDVYNTYSFVREIPLFSDL